MRRGLSKAREVGRVVAAAVLVELGLRVTTLPRVARWCGVRLDLTSARGLPSSPVVLPPGTRRTLRTVDAVMARWPFGDTCLRRCLVLGRRLSVVRPVLRIGVATGADGGVQAHSWLEIDGRVMDDSADSYSQFGDAT